MCSSEFLHNSSIQRWIPLEYEGERNLSMNDQTKSVIIQTKSIYHEDVSHVCWGPGSVARRAT